MYCPHGNTVTHEMGCDCDFRFAIPSLFGTEMVEWIQDNVPAIPGVYLIHFDKAIADTGTGKAKAQHFLGYAANVQLEMLSLLTGRNRETRFSHIVNVANAKGIKWHPSKIWMATDVKDAEVTYHYMKGNGAFIRKCPECMS